MSTYVKTEFNEEDFKEDLFPGLLELSTDLNAMWKEGLHSDITLRSIGKHKLDFKCHKAVLNIRSKWFSANFCQASTTEIDHLIKIKESDSILKAVLTYIYSGNLKLLESLDIPLVDLYDAALRYGLMSLRELVGDVIKSECTLENTKTIEFIWRFKMNRNDRVSCACPTLNNFSLHGNDKWGMEIIRTTKRDGTSTIEFYLLRKVINGVHNIHHIINITVESVISDIKEPVFSEVAIVSKNGKHKLCAFATTTNSRLCPLDDTITLSCNLKVCPKVGDIARFKLKGIYRRHISNELITLSEDMLEMLKKEKYTDISFKFKKCTSPSKLHSYIIHARSKMPIPSIGKLGEIVDFESAAWQSFIYFLYTGQSRYLDDHMGLVYSAFRKCNLEESAQKYKNILVKHVNLHNAYGILRDSVNNGDTHFITSISHFLASNAGFLLEPENWIRIARNDSKRAVFQNWLN